LKFLISSRARGQIEAAQAWWVDNRPSAQALFLDELSSAERLLREDPLFGAAYVPHKSGAVRRVLLSGTQKHLYYRYRPDRDELTVLAVWGARRSRGPKL
jgi:plasmid stabilization system protein ParE